MEQNKSYLNGAKLQRLKRAACIIITGVIRTTPTTIMETLPDLPSLSMKVGLQPDMAQSCRTSKDKPPVLQGN